LRRAYDLLVEQGKEAALAEPDPFGREQQPYVSAALSGRGDGSWFRSSNTGKAVVAFASPITDGNEILGAVILQQGTDAILSLTNKGLSRLIYLTLITTLVVAGALLGYATWLSRRIRALSIAAEDALDGEDLNSALPSALADDEVGDLSRSFSWVLQQLGEYNAYLRSLASKLSHELRTPLAIVTSSLENLEHEPLNEASLGYTARAREGADRLRRILSAMSEASRVEGLMAHAEPERFDLRAVLDSTTAAYRDVYKERAFEFDSDLDSATKVTRSDWDWVSGMAHIRSPLRIRDRRFLIACVRSCSIRWYRCAAAKTHNTSASAFTSLASSLKGTAVTFVPTTSMAASALL